MKRFTKKQLQEVKKNYKSNFRRESRVESFVRDLNNEPIFVETICNALDMYMEMLGSTPASSWYGNSELSHKAKIDVSSYLYGKVKELR